MTELDQMLAAEVRQRLRDRRERIATAALQGMLVRAESVAPNEWSYILVTHAVEYADTLIAELDKEPQP